VEMCVPQFFRLTWTAGSGAPEVTD
jgi:hypothetical protein